MTLSWSLFTKNMRPHAQLRSKLHQKISRLEKHLEHFHADAVHMKVNLERYPKKYWFSASITLKLPVGTLRATKFSEDPMTAFEQSVRALRRELAGLKAILRHESDWKPEAARRLRAPKQSVPVLAAIAATNGQAQAGAHVGA